MTQTWFLLQGYIKVPWSCDSCFWICRFLDEEIDSGGRLRFYTHMEDVNRSFIKRLLGAIAVMNIGVFHFFPTSSMERDKLQPIESTKSRRSKSWLHPCRRRWDDYLHMPILMPTVASIAWMLGFASLPLITPWVHLGDCCWCDVNMLLGISPGTRNSGTPFPYASHTIPSPNTSREWYWSSMRMGVSTMGNVSPLIFELVLWVYEWEKTVV